MPSSVRVHTPADDHGAEAFLLRQVAGDQRPQEAAEIDAHVEHRERRVTAGIVRCVEFAHHHADVWLQQARAQHDQGQAEVERRRGRNGEREVTGSDENAARQYCTPRAEYPVRQPATRNTEKVHHGGIGAVDGRRRGAIQPHAARGQWGRHEQDEEAAHAVVGKALPHFGEEQRGQPDRVSEKLAV